jgi:hypothetical protein
MSHGPSLIFDKSSLESLNLDEAALLDNFYRSTITPLFFVECLADLEKKISSTSTPEQLVGSLADRTPESQSMPNVHHVRILKGELTGVVRMEKIHGRPMIDYGQRVQLGGQKGVVFKRSQEYEALQRWTERQFLEVERNIAKQWRHSLTQINFEQMVKTVMGPLGHWRKPKSLADAKLIADNVIDNLDPEWLLRFGLTLLGVPEAVDWTINDWISHRHPPLRERYPYFILMLTINIFFCLVLPTQLLSKVKQSHSVDLAYLYYLPFCSVFTSKDNFHAQVVPLFLQPEQTFVNGNELKEDLKQLVSHYSSLPDEVLRSGLIHFAAYPPDDTAFLVTRLWDKYLPDWRRIKAEPRPSMSPEEEKQMVEHINQLSEATETHNEQDFDLLDYALIERRLSPRKGRWLRFSEEQIARMNEKDKNR